MGFAGILDLRGNWFLFEFVESCARFRVVEGGDRFGIVFLFRGLFEFLRFFISSVTFSFVRVFCSLAFLFVGRFFTR